MMYNGNNWTEIRQEIVNFLEAYVYPNEHILEGKERSLSDGKLKELKDLAKSKGLWAIGHPEEIGGQGMPFMEFVYINEVIGRSEYAQKIFGSYTQQDSIMLHQYASRQQKESYLKPMVSGDIYPSFAMTEPEIASSDPTQLETIGVLENEHWCVNGHKWFTTGADIAAYTTIMCRTEHNVPDHKAFTMIIVPTDALGYEIVRDTPILGMNNGHFEVKYTNIKVPQSNQLGERGQGFLIAQKRLGPGRIFHAMRWLGQAQRAFDLMCQRLHERTAFGSVLADKQLMQQHVFDSLNEIQACRQLTLHAAQCIDSGDSSRVEIGLIKVAGARMINNVIDRAIQVYGAKGLTDDTPLSRMYRHAREARIYDGPDEVHIQSVARQVLKRYKLDGPGFDFGSRDALFK
jgi:acyl-CoA dehydrogenase